MDSFGAFPVRRAWFPRPPMSRFIRLLGYALAGLVALVAVAYGAVTWISTARLHRIYTVTVESVPIPGDAGAIARGRHLAVVRGCAECHGDDLGGAVVVDNALLGTVHGPNLTRGRGGATAGLTDADWVRAIRHGIGATGRPLFIMPSEDMAHYSDDDVGAIIAYAKSVPPVDRATVPIRLGPLGRVLVTVGAIQLAADKIDHNHIGPDRTPPGVTVAYGRYLAVTCVGCHGPRFTGGKIAGAPPDWPPAKNLTPDPSNAISKWTEQDFINTLRTAHRPDGTELSPVMPRAMGQMTDDELKALWLFLRTLDPVPNGAN